MRILNIFQQNARFVNGQIKFFMKKIDLLPFLHHSGQPRQLGCHKRSLLQLFSYSAGHRGRPRQLDYQEHKHSLLQPFSHIGRHCPAGFRYIQGCYIT